MALILVPVCNICRDATRPTTTYSLQRGTEETEVALCEGDDVLAEFFTTAETLPKKAVKKAPAKRVSSRSKLAGRHATLAEIEAAKKS